LKPGADLIGAFVVIRPGGIHDPTRNILEKLRQDIDIMAHRTQTKLFLVCIASTIQPNFRTPPNFIPSGPSYITVLWDACAFFYI
jgi:hypothetical protein